MHPQLPSRKGRVTTFKNIHGRRETYTVVDEEVFVAPESQAKDKAFAIHKLKFDDGREEFRIGYYRIAQRPRMKGKWAWGQYAPMMTAKEMTEIFYRAEKLRLRCS